jgi:protein SCO1/2
MLTDKMARVQDELGDKFGRMISFVSITVDPERDTPKILKNYAKAFGADPIGWYFLTGTVDEVRNVERSFGVYAAKAPDETVDHTFLTSLIDTEGNLRVQYLGYRFDQEEFKRDLLSLVDESR